MPRCLILKEVFFRILKGKLIITTEVTVIKQKYVPCLCDQSVNNVKSSNTPKPKVLNNNKFTSSTVI